MHCEISIPHHDLQLVAHTRRILAFRKVNDGMLGGKAKPPDIPEADRLRKGQLATHRLLASVAHDPGCGRPIISLSASNSSLPNPARRLSPGTIVSVY
jgi:hypothetical protein